MYVNSLGRSNFNGFYYGNDLLCYLGLESLYAFLWYKLNQHVPLELHKVSVNGIIRDNHVVSDNRGNRWKKT